MQDMQGKCETYLCTSPAWWAEGQTGQGWGSSSRAGSEQTAATKDTVKWYGMQ